MPEVITKYPDILKKELTDVGVRCGQGVKAKILTSCPEQDLCILPTGEICIYTIDQIPQMTQLSTSEIIDRIGPFPTIYSNLNIIFLCIACLFGLIVGILVAKRKVNTKEQ